MILHVEGVIVAGGLEQQLALLDTSGVLQRIVHHCKAEKWETQLGISS